MLMHQLLYDGASAPSRQARVPLGRSRQGADLRGGGRPAMERFAGALHHLGVRKGDRVTIFAHNGMDYLLGLFACWRIGAIAALVNMRFADELDYYFADHEPSVVIYTHDMLEPVQAAAAKAPLGAGAGLHGRSAARRREPACSARRRLRRAARSGGRGRDCASLLHLGHHRQAEGRVPRARADHAGGELHRRAPADHQRRCLVRADRAVELVSARRQSAAAAASRRRPSTSWAAGRRRAASMRWSARRRRILVGNPTLLNELLIEVAPPRPHARASCGSTVSGGAPVPPTLEARAARRMEAAARRELRPERTRRLHGAGRSGACRRGEVRRRRASAARQGGAHPRCRRRRMPDRRGRRGVPARRLHDRATGASPTRPPRRCAAAGCTAATPAPWTPTATSPCAAASPN